jgi:glyoxylase-like metal-dependent hydrolase (beta-lactamase superfamily II)
MAMEAERSLVEGTAPAMSPVGKLAGIQATGLKLGRGLCDGDVATVGQVPVKVLALPGHTAGSAAYLLAGGLYVGDSLTVERGGGSRATPTRWGARNTTNTSRRPGRWR